MNSRTISFHTLGCKLNFAETSAIGKSLLDSGYNKVAFSEGADVVLINTCSVTENANRECRSVVNRALAANPESVIVVTGCFAQLKPDAVAEIPGVDLVLGAGEKFNVAGYLEQFHEKGTPVIKACDISDVKEFIGSRSEGDRTRVFLKVQDGCDYSCTFCTIPMARGASRSNAISNVLADVENIIVNGAKEIVLTGINLGDYGILNPDSGKRDVTLLQLLQAISLVPDLPRVRLSSVEPNLLTDEIISLVAETPQFMPHFHMPLQSGSDHILKKMKRRYLSSLYESRVSMINTMMPDAAIGVDVITGFPGETDAEFETTYKFLSDLDVAYLHVFTYSERENTLAAEMDEVVPMAIRKQRTNRLRMLSLKKQYAFVQKQIGAVRPVLFESEHKDGKIYGYTDNYIRVAVPFQPELMNSIVNCRLDAVDADGELNVTLLTEAPTTGYVSYAI